MDGRTDGQTDRQICSVNKENSAFTRQALSLSLSHLLRLLQFVRLSSNPAPPSEHNTRRALCVYVSQSLSPSVHHFISDTSLPIIAKLAVCNHATEDLIFVPSNTLSTTQEQCELLRWDQH
jgi:hypothetical protein